MERRDQTTSCKNLRRLSDWLQLLRLGGQPVDDDLQPLADRPAPVGDVPELGIAVAGFCGHRAEPFRAVTGLGKGDEVGGCHAALALAMAAFAWH